MNWGGPDFIVIIVIVCTGGWIMNNWIRARHGYPLEDEWGGKSAKLDGQVTARLQEENAALRMELGAITDRLASVERIVTDQGYDVARQIEGLREARQEVTIR